MGGIMEDLFTSYIGDDEQLYYKKLNYLRKTVTLKPSEYIKVAKARKSAMRLTELYNKHEKRDLIGVDYSVADQLEYELRMKTYERIMYKMWVSYGKNELLRDFCERCLIEEMQEELNKIN